MNVHSFADVRGEKCTALAAIRVESFRDATISSFRFRRRINRGQRLSKSAKLLQMLRMSKIHKNIHSHAKYI